MISHDHGTIPEYTVEAVYIGPTWARGEDGRFLLPERTLGWQILRWIARYINGGGGMSFQPTKEQARFILWWYALDEQGRFVYRDGVLQRIKGWGKDPIVAVLALVEMLGPCRFSHWAEESDEEWDIAVGDPVGVEHEQGWVQVVAVSAEQTKNTMKLLPAMISKQLMAEHGMTKLDIGKTFISAYGGSRVIEAVTSSPATLEGGRPTFTILNEALALDTPIPTPTGWTTMGELRDGDVVYGDNGKPCTVTKAHPTQEGRRSFKITFGEGDSIVASDGHFWTVALHGKDNRTWRDMTTQEMFDADREFWVPDLRPLETGPNVELLVDPYILGLWLGDGSSRGAQIACDARDINEVAEELTRLGVRAVKKTGARGLHLTLADTCRSGREVGYKRRSVQSKLRQMGLLQNKHIPISYLRASREQRLALLQGLMDSDGSIRPTGEARFCNANSRLIEGVRELLLGLGIPCNQAKWQIRDPKKWPNRAHWKPMGTLSFVAYSDVPAFRLNRKAQYMRAGSNQRLKRRIVKIESIESVPVRCISVDSPTHLFLAGPGAHPTRNTHHWTSGTGGHDLAEVIQRNSTKSAGGNARTLSITNAYDPSQDSVAQRQREAWEAEQTGEAIQTGMFYDSIEAPESITMRPPEAADQWKAPAKDDAEKAFREACTRAWLSKIIEAVRGDAVWLDTPSIVNAVLRGTTPAHVARRFWFNNIVSAADRWADPPAIETATHPLLRTRRQAERDGDQLRIGWIVDPDDPIVMFFDGSKNEDTTALVGCRVDDGYTFVIGVWAKPRGEAGKGWQVPREEVSARVDEAFERFNIVAFWGDPSHTLEDDNTRFWDRFIDSWHQKYGEHLQKDLWSVKSGVKVSAISWDMADPQRTKQFVAAAEIVRSDLHHRNPAGDYAPSFRHDGHPALRAHLRNCRENRSEHGVSVRKNNRDSGKKIDLAVCLIGAQMLRRLALNVGLEELEDSGGWVTSL